MFHLGGAQVVYKIDVYNRNKAPSDKARKPRLPVGRTGNRIPKLKTLVQQGILK